jgi:hypothetical protein
MVWIPRVPAGLRRRTGEELVAVGSDDAALDSTRLAVSGQPEEGKRRTHRLYLSLAVKKTMHMV